VKNEKILINHKWFCPFHKIWISEDTEKCPLCKEKEIKKKNQIFFTRIRYYDRHPEKIREKLRKWRLKNPEKYKSYFKKWWLKNREEYNKKQKENYYKNREKILKQQAEYYQRKKIARFEGKSRPSRFRRDYLEGSRLPQKLC
jgi:hypothetical protein